MDKEYGVVFSGGGTKGAYQVGAVKALKELGLNIKAVSGASIGSINAAMFVQDNIDLLEELYKNIGMKDILEMSDKNAMADDANIFEFKNIKKLVGEYVKGKGISNKPLRNLLEKYIDVDKIYKSDIDFGFMTFNATNKAGKAIWKEDIRKEELIDYLLASACFPIFKAQEIEGTKYLDGGISNNMPIDLLVEKGYKDIIIVDIKGIGFIKKNVYKDVNYYVIKPYEDLGGVFDFDKERINRNITLGYLDTMKAFHKLQGLTYYFKKEEYFKLLGKYSIEELIGLEEAASIYKIDKYKVYTSKSFTKELLKCYKEEKVKYEKMGADITKLKNIRDLIKEGCIFVLLDDLLNNYPSLLSTYKGIFAKYIRGSESMTILFREEGLEE